MRWAYDVRGRCLRFAEPEAGEEWFVGVASVEPGHGLVDDQFAHPAVNLTCGLTIAMKGFRVLAEVGGIREPVIEAMVAGIGLRAGFEVARAMPFSCEHGLVATEFQLFGDGGFRDGNVKGLKTGEVVHTDAVGTSTR